jgi:hypothetical protein
MLLNIQQHAPQLPRTEWLVRIENNAMVMNWVSSSDVGPLVTTSNTK